MRWDELPRSDNVEDRRADGPRGMPMGRTGGIGIGTLIVLCLIGWALGINPLDLIEGQIGSGSSDTQQQTQPAPGREAQAPSDQMGQFVAAVLGSTEVQWKEISPPPERPMRRRRWSCFPAPRARRAGSPRPRWDLSIVRTIGKSISTPQPFQDLERRFRGCEVGSKGCQFSKPM
jgi:hypothetical protein